MSDTQDYLAPLEEPAQPVRQPKNSSSGISVAAFVFSILGGCLIGAVPGLVLGIVGLRDARKSAKPSGLAVAAIVISSLWLALYAAVFAVDAFVPDSGLAGNPAKAPGQSGAVSSSPDASPGLPDYMSIVTETEIVNPKGCTAYESVLAKRKALAEKTLQDGKEYQSDSWAAAKYVVTADWIGEDFEADLKAALTKAAAKALNNVSNERASELKSLDTYLRDSLEKCGLTEDFKSALTQAGKVNRLGEFITAAADRKPWYPKGFELYGGGIAYKFIDGAGSSCYGCSYWTMEIITQAGCPSGLYVELNVLDRNDTVIDWTNDSLPSLSAGEKARLQFQTYNSAVDSARISDIQCY